MSLRAAALAFWRRSNLSILVGIASGEEQKRPRNDIIHEQGGNFYFYEP